MSALFNLLLFIGVFWLILLVPEPGEKRAKRAHSAADRTQPTRKVA